MELSSSALADVTPRDLPGESSPSDALLEMHGPVYRGPGWRAWEERPRPVLIGASVRFTTSTTADLHVLTDDVPSVPTHG